MIAHILTENRKYFIVATLIAACCFSSYYFNSNLKIGPVYSHSFYIPIIISALWWQRKGIIVALFFAIFLICSNLFLGLYKFTAGDIFRSAMFLVVAVITAILSERISRSAVALVKSNQRYQNILDGIQEGYFENDLAGNLTFANNATCNILGYSRNELIGMNNRRYARPDTAKRMFAIFNEIYRTGNPAEVRDYEIIRKDWTSRTLEMSASPMRNEDDVITGFRGLVRDVTKRKQAEKELRESDERYRLHFTNTSEVIYTLDPAMQILNISPGVEKMLGYKPEELVGRSIHDLNVLSPESLSQAMRDAEEVFAGKNVSELNYCFITRSGERRIGEVSGVPLMRDGTVVSIISVARDITKRKKAEDDLESHRTHLELINKILRHDLINNLSVIQGSLNLYRQSRDEDTLATASQYITKSANLIRQMRDLESFITDHKELKIINIKDVINPICSNYPHCEIRIEGGGTVIADESLDSVIDNILGNAILHGMADVIDISIAGERNGHCEVRIADNGIGIADNIKDKIFDEGFSFGERGNSGLGLHIVNKAMQSYGGYVYIEDNEPQGTVFILRFKRIH